MIDLEWIDLVQDAVPCSTLIRQNQELILNEPWDELRANNFTNPNQQQFL